MAYKTRRRIPTLEEESYGKGEGMVRELLKRGLESGSYEFDQALNKKLQKLQEKERYNRRTAEEIDNMIKWVLIAVDACIASEHILEEGTPRVEIPSAKIKKDQVTEPKTQNYLKRIEAPKLEEIYDRTLEMFHDLFLKATFQDKKKIISAAENKYMLMQYTFPWMFRSADGEPLTTVEMGYLPQIKTDDELNNMSNLDLQNFYLKLIGLFEGWIRENVKDIRITSPINKKIRPEGIRQALKGHGVYFVAPELYQGYSYKAAEGHISRLENDRAVPCDVLRGLLSKVQNPERLVHPVESSPRTEIYGGTNNLSKKTRHPIGIILSHGDVSICSQDGAEKAQRDHSTVLLFQ